MWDAQKRQRLQQLRERGNGLNGAELAELAALTNELTDAEATYLNGATQRLRDERERLEQENRHLETLAARRRALVHRLETVLTEARAECEAIDSELALVSPGTNSPDAD